MSAYACLRRFFAGAAAALALSGTAHAAAAIRPAPPLAASKLPASCLDFDSQFSRRQYPYDEPLERIVQRMKRYAGFESLMQDMNKAGKPVLGVCVGHSEFSPVEYANGAIFFNVIDLNRIPVAPEVFTKKIENDEYLILDVTMTVLRSMVMEQTYGLRAHETDAHTWVFLKTIEMSESFAEGIMFAVNDAVRYNEGNALKSLREKLPKLNNNIDGLVAQTLKAVDQGRDLNNAERIQFRQDVATTYFKNMDIRESLAKEWLNENIEHLGANNRYGWGVNLPNVAPFDMQMIREKLRALSPVIAATPFLKDGYMQFCNQIQDRDPVAFFQRGLITAVKEMNAEAGLKPRARILHFGTN